ncbi:hypothetical protein ACWEKM_33370 [Streptomyces sp. NPDC004752]
MTVGGARAAGLERIGHGRPCCGRLLGARLVRHPELRPGRAGVGWAARTDADQ